MSTELTTSRFSNFVKHKIGKLHSSRASSLTSRTKTSPAVKNQKPLKHTIPTTQMTIDLQVLKGDALIESIKKVIKTLFGITSNNFNMKRMSGALTNAVFYVFIGEKPMLLRVYGIGCEEIIDREKELDWLGRLSQLHIGPKLLGIFGNGRFEEYLPSTTLTSLDIRQPDMSKEIAFRMNQLHSIVDQYPPKKHQPVEVWTTIDKWYQSLSTELLTVLKEKHSESVKDIEIHFNLTQLAQEIKLCKSILSENNSPITFAHNDTQYGNILKVNGTNELVVIDFEYAGYNPRGYDIVNHFCEWMYDYHSDEPAKMNLDKYPTKEQQYNFLKSYNNNDNIKEVFWKEVDQWKLACHLFWSLWGLVQATQSEIEFDYLGYSTQRIQAFRNELIKYQ